jgi:hypothetical protein
MAYGGGRAVAVVKRARGVVPPVSRVPPGQRPARMLQTHIGTRTGIMPVTGIVAPTVEDVQLGGIFSFVGKAVKAIVKPVASVAAHLVPGGTLIKSIAGAAVNTFVSKAKPAVKAAAGAALQQAGRQAAGAAVRSPGVRGYIGTGIMDTIQPYLIPVALGVGAILLLRGGGRR